MITTKTTTIILFQNLLLMMAMLLSTFTVSVFSSASNNSSKFTMIGQEKLRQIMWPVLTDENNEDKTLISNLGIINGDKVAEGKYRFTASLQLNVKEKNDWAFFCGGTYFFDSSKLL